jgi:hypothetical protein
MTLVNARKHRTTRRRLDDMLTKTPLFCTASRTQDTAAH